MAQAFSSALDSAFMLDSDVNNLSQTIDQKWVTLESFPLLSISHAIILPLSPFNFVTLTSPKEATGVDPEPRIGRTTEPNPRGRETSPVPVRQWKHIPKPGTSPVSWWALNLIFCGPIDIAGLVCAVTGSDCVTASQGPNEQQPDQTKQGNNWISEHISKGQSKAIRSWSWELEVGTSAGQDSLYPWYWTRAASDRRNMFQLFYRDNSFTVMFLFFFFWHPLRNPLLYGSEGFIPKAHPLFALLRRCASPILFGLEIETLSIRFPGTCFDLCVPTLLVSDMYGCMDIQTRKVTGVMGLCPIRGQKLDTSVILKEGAGHKGRFSWS
jgi:hypothetical protein